MGAQRSKAVVFVGAGSSPSSSQAGCVVNAFVPREGYDLEQLDAAQAYLLARLRGIPTWVMAPRDQWPEVWSGMRMPAVGVKVACYGRRVLGTDWEQHSVET